MAWTGFRFSSLLAELRRRQVLRVVGIYAIVVWLVIQVAADTFTPLGVADWIHTALIVALVACFPVVAVLAWVFDITPEGIVRTEPAEFETALNDFGAAVSEHPRLWIDIAIIAVLLGIVAFLLIKPYGMPSTVRDPSIAVLPFVDISERRDNEYFSDGLTEALIATLAQLPGIRVASATSSFALKGQRPDLADIGERLGVGTVLEGSVRKAPDNSLKITAQLIDVASNFHLWSETYDGHLDDIFNVQEDIARSVAARLKVGFTPGAFEALDDHSAGNISAYDLYLRGRGELRGALTQENLERAIGHFKDAIRIDPRHALADAGLCIAYMEMYELTRDTAHIDQANDSCNTARLRVKTLPDLHVALGRLYLGTGRHGLASQEYTAALTLDAANVEARRGLGLVQWRQGDLVAAEATLQQVTELDPAYWRGYASLGALLYVTGRYADAARVFSAGLERDPGNLHLHLNLGAAHGARLDFERAAAAFRRSTLIHPTPEAYRNTGINMYYLGDFEQAREMFEHALELAPGQYENHLWLADTCGQLEHGAACATVHHLRALELAEERVRVMPDNARTIADLAVLYARVGDMESAREMAGWAETLDRSGYEVPRALAVVAMHEDEHERAFELLTDAVARGFPARMLVMLPDFDALQDDPRFRDLTGAGAE